MPPTLPRGRLGAVVVDLVLALLVVLWAVAGYLPLEQRLGSPTAATALGVVALAVILTGRGRRTHPLPVIATLTIAPLLLSVAAGYEMLQIPLLAAAFMAQAYEPNQRRRAVIVVVASASVLALAVWDLGLNEALPSVALLLAVIGWGSGVRSSRRYRESLVRRAEDAERERDLRAARAVAEERARIARDIHDVVSHSLAVVVVQAAGARRVADRDPERAKQALDVIAETARGALTEMRAMLQVLRSPDADQSPAAPSPGLPEIDSLAADMTARGLTLEVTTTGTPFRLKPGAELAMYRVIQESLTNALKHGDRSRAARLTLRYEPDALTAVVVNARSGESDHEQPLVPGSGSGQRGMRERLGLYGGTLELGGSDSEYWTRASIPREEGRAEPAGPRTEVTRE